MLLSLKELFCILVIATAIFRLSKPIALLFMTAEDFSRRRNVWFALTITAFLSPSFWLFVAVAVPVLAIAGKRDSNPSALYLLLLHVIPPMGVPVPMVGMPYLFIINNYLLLSFCVLTPAALRLIRSKEDKRILGLQTMDYCLLAYGALTAVLFVHYERPDGGLYPATVTDCARRAFVFFFGIFVPYFSISRASGNRRAILDNLASFCLSCGLMAAVAVFEGAKHWLLYADMAGRWDIPIGISFYLMRGESLRSIASAGHSLGLGDLLVVGFGVWLYLQTHVKSKVQRVAVTLLLWSGLFAAYARGAWIAAVFVYFVAAALGPRAYSRVLKSAFVGLFAALIVSLTPLGARVARVLPFFGGSVDNANIVYRDRLLDRAWQIIQESPWLGDQEALLKMQDLRQGQGIIDLVNSYIQVLLDNGFLGLTLFLAFFLIPLFKAWKATREAKRVDKDFSLLGASIVSCMLGTLLFIENGSFSGGAERVFYVLAAIAAAYSYLWRSQQRRDLVGVQRAAG
jgi:O-antigen ligase